MTKENYERKVLYSMLAQYTGKNAYAVRMWFFRHRESKNVLSPNDFFEYAERNRQKGGNT